MTLKLSLWGIKISTLLLLVACILVIINVDPYNSGMVGFALFYSSFFLMTAGIFTLFFIWMRRRVSGDEFVIEHLGINFRQGLLIALLAAALMALQGMRILTWWDGLLVVGAIFLIELYYLSR